MAKQILNTAEYTFNAVAKTVTFIGFPALEFQHILLITNVVDNVVIYQFNKSSLGGSFSTGVLTLTYNTASMSNSDELQIIIDIDSAASTVTANAGTNLNTSALALETTATAIKNAVETIDNAISGSEMQVDIVTMPTVTISDGGGSITVDGTVSITGAGDATAANQTTIIGHVDGIENLLTTIDSDTGNISTKIDTLAGAVLGAEMQVDIISMPNVTIGSLPNEGQQLMSNSISVAISSDQSAIPISGTISVNQPVSIDDNGGSITVDGTVTVNAGTNLNTSALALESTQTTQNTRIGDLTEAAPGTDTASSGLNGRLQRIAQRLSSLITTLGSPFQVGGSIGNTAFGVNNAGGVSAVNIQDGGNSITVDDGGSSITVDGTVELGSTSLSALENINVTVTSIGEVEVKNDTGNPIPVSGTITANAGTNLNTSALALETTLSAQNTLVGAVNETAPGTDTASSGLNGRLQRIAQRLSTLITNLGSPFQSGGSIGNTAFGVNNGSGASAVNIQDGGNSITIDAVSLPLPTGSATETTLSAINTKTPSLGQTTMTNSIPVTLASNQGAIVVVDGGFSITVDSVNLDIRDLTFAADKVDASGTILGAGTNNIGDVDVLSLPPIPAGNNNIGDVDIASIAAGTNYIGKVRLTDGITDGEIVPLTGYNAQAVAIVDGSGNQLTSFGGGTQYADGVVRGTATGTLMMGDDGTNIQSLKSDASGVLAIQDNGGSITIDAASLPLPTGAATETTLSSVNTKLTEGQDTMANSIPVVIASNQTAIPVSDNGGSLTVDGTVTANISGSIANTSFIATQATAANLNATVVGTGTFATQISAALPAGTNNIGDVDILSTVEPLMISGSGTLTGTTQNVALTLQGQANTTFQLTGTWVGTVQFEASNDNSVWTSIFGLKAGDNIISTTATTNDIYRCTTAGFAFVRAICTVFTSGSIVVTARASSNTSGIFLNFPLPTGTNSIGQVTSNIGNTIFTNSAGNSSTAQLTAGSTFTGTVENVISGISFLVSIRSDQPLTINVLQYIDSGGTQLIGTNTFTRLANQPFNEAIQMNGNYARVTVKNEGVGSTTNLVIDSWFGNIPPFPSAVTNEGNFKVAIAQNSARNKVGLYGFSSFRILGTAATPQNLFTIENPTGSVKKLAIRKLEVLVDTTAVLVSVSPSIKLSRPAALPTGGTTLTAVKWDTTMANTVAIARNGTASDGGAATAITVTAGTAVLSTRYVTRLHTAVGQVINTPYDLLENFGNNEPIILNANESIVVQVVLANAITTHFVVNAIVEEYV